MSFLESTFCSVDLLCTESGRTIAECEALRFRVVIGCSRDSLDGQLDGTHGDLEKYRLPGTLLYAVSPIHKRSVYGTMLKLYPKRLPSTSHHS